MGVEEKERIIGVVFGIDVRNEAARGKVAGLIAGAIAGAKRDLRSVLAMAGNCVSNWRHPIAVFQSEARRDAPMSPWLNRRWEFSCLANTLRRL